MVTFAGDDAAERSGNRRQRVGGERPGQRRQQGTLLTLDPDLRQIRILSSHGQKFLNTDITLITSVIKATLCRSRW